MAACEPSDSKTFSGKNPHKLFNNVSHLRIETGKRESYWSYAMGVFGWVWLGGWDWFG